MTGTLSVVPWSVNTAEVPVEFLNREFDYGIHDALPAQLKDAGRTVATQVGRKDAHTVGAVLRGALKRAPRQWFAVRNDSLLGDGSYRVIFKQHATVAEVVFRHDCVELQLNDRAEQYPVANGLHRALFLLDYQSATPGQIARVDVLIAHGVEMVRAFSFILPERDPELGVKLGLVASRVNRDIEVKTSFEKPPAGNVPAGYQRCVAEEATVREFTAPPVLMRADRSGAYGTLTFGKGSLHLYDGRALYPIVTPTVYPDSRTDTTIHGQWSFNEPVRVQDLVLTRNGSSMALTPGLPPASATGVNTLINTPLPIDAAIENVYVVGSVLQGLREARNALVTGQGLSSVDTITNSVVQTTGSLDQTRDVHNSILTATGSLSQAQTVHRSTVYGTHVAARAKALENTALHGNGIAPVADRVEDSIAVGNDIVPTAKRLLNTVTIGNRVGSHLAIDESVVVGNEAACYAPDPVRNVTAVGRGSSALVFNDSVALGHQAQPLSKATVQLGNAATRPVAFTGLSVRADARDIHSKRELTVGLDLVRKLQPREVVWDLREHYLPARPVEPSPLRGEPQPPRLTLTAPNYNAVMTAYQQDHAAWLLERDRHKAAMIRYETAFVEWLRAVEQLKVTRNGKHKSERAQSVLLAQEVEQAARELNVPAPGVIHHRDRGGIDAYTLDTNELVPVLVRAIQELDTKMTQEATLERIAAKVLDLIDQRKR